MHIHWQQPRCAFGFLSVLGSLNLVKRYILHLAALVCVVDTMRTCVGSETFAVVKVSIGIVLGILRCPLTNMKRTLTVSGNQWSKGFTCYADKPSEP